MPHSDNPPDDIPSDDIPLDDNPNALRNTPKVVLVSPLKSTISSHIRYDDCGNGKPFITCTWDKPLSTGETTLPVTTCVMQDGEEVEVDLLTMEDSNPLATCVAVVAGPDAEGQWYCIECSDDYTETEVLN